MIAECSHCGAPLDVAAGTSSVRCIYCNRANRVRTMRTLHQVRPAQWEPPPVWTPPPHASLPRTGGNPAACLIAAVAILGVLGTGAAVFVFAGANTTGGTFGIGGVDPDGAPRLGTWSPGQGDGTWSGTVNPSLNVPTTFGFDCAHGKVESDPTLAIVLQSPHQVRVSVSTGQGKAPCVVLQEPGGQVHCDFQNGTGPARVSALLPAGRHAVWVGDVFQSTVPYDLEVSASPTTGTALPSGLVPNGEPLVAALDLDTQQGAFSGPGAVEGDIELRGVDISCRGYTTLRPHLTLSTSEPRSVTFTAEAGDGRTDLTMLLRHPDGTVVCDDDSGSGNNPQIGARLAAGTHQLWVGTFDEHGTAEITIRMGEPTTAEVLPSGVAPQGTPLLGQVDLDRPRSAPMEGQTVAEVEARRLSAPCPGFIPVRPHAVLHTTATRTVTLTTSADADLTMVLRRPDGTVICDDDSGRNRQPRIHTQLEPGAYPVWVGAFDAGASGTPFTLRVSR